jgi:hypothetical protein
VGTSLNPHAGVANAVDPATASASSARSIQHIPLHSLGAQGNTIPANGVTSSDDGARISASSAEAPDQRVPREVDELVRLAVALKLDVLTVNGQEARALLSRPNGFHAPRNICLTNCRDADLIELVAIVKATEHAPFALILDRNYDTLVSERALNALSEATFSSITLRDLDISANAAQALARGASPVSISLPMLLPQPPDLQHILTISTLRSLRASPHHFPDHLTSAVASHPYLTEFSIGAISAAAVRAIARSVTIQSLSLEYIADNEVTALAALADNSALRSLTIDLVRQPQSLAALSRHNFLRFLTLDLHSDAHAGIPYLANLPTLEVLSLRDSTFGSMLLRAEHVQALCARSFEELSLLHWDIEPAAQRLIAAAPSRHLSLNHSKQFSNAAMSVLSMNRSIASL